MQKVIIACDFSSRDELWSFLACFSKSSEKLFLKLGWEIITKLGWEIVTELKNKGHQIFLDLKLHDIPNTVQKALHNLINLRPDYISIHLLGGKKMVKGAQQVCASSDTKLIGVSILTSLSQHDLEQILSNKISLSNTVKTLVRLAQDSGLTNIVCSAQEAYVVKQSFPEMICFCPGIRLEAEHGDQKRIVSPGEAQKLQADYIIVGREITKNKDPYKHYLKIKKAFIDGKKV